jgi:hypothetical protein
MLSLPATGYRLRAAVPLLACLYLPFVSGGLLTDDFAHVLHLTQIDSAARLVDATDAFGFYRPVTQSSIALELATYGQHFAPFRALNVVLHAGVLLLAFLVARLVLESSLAAGLAALAFALTPKAHPIAVLWISARAELLMSLFSFAAVAAWIVWTRRGRSAWLAAAGLAYALALLSKETAALLPLLLLVTPRPERPLASRVAAVTGLIGLAALIFAWRAHTGALTPFAGDQHYDLMVPLTLWARNAVNYVGRMLVAPLGLIVVVAIAGVRFSRPRRAGASASASHAPPRRLRPALYDDMRFSLVWVMVFLAPVLPIALRSELYLYLPVFGLCLLAGGIAEALVHRAHSRRAVAVAIGVYAIALAGYQIARARDVHRDLVFSEALVAALRDDPALASVEGEVILAPSNAETSRFLEDSIGGYLSLVLSHATGNRRLTRATVYRDTSPPSIGTRLTCEYRDGRVQLTYLPR